VYAPLSCRYVETDLDCSSYNRQPVECQLVFEVQQPTVNLYGALSGDATSAGFGRSTLPPPRTDPAVSNATAGLRHLTPVGNLSLNDFFVQLFIEVEPFQDELQRRGDQRRAAILRQAVERLA
jgi:hypothetical protein